MLLKLYMLEPSGSVKYANENCQQLWHFFGVLRVFCYTSVVNWALNLLQSLNIKVYKFLQNQKLSCMQLSCTERKSFHRNHDRSKP